MFKKSKGHDSGAIWSEQLGDENSYDQYKL